MLDRLRIKKEIEIYERCPGYIFLFIDTFFSNYPRYIKSRLYLSNGTNFLKFLGYKQAKTLVQSIIFIYNSVKFAVLIKILTIPKISCLYLIYVTALFLSNQ